MRRDGTQTTFQTEMGQLVDLITAPEDRVDLSNFSLEKCVLHAFGLCTRADPRCLGQTRVHRAIQDGVLQLLPLCRARDAHVRRTRIIRR